MLAERWGFDSRRTERSKGRSRSESRSRNGSRSMVGSAWEGAGGKEGRGIRGEKRGKSVDEQRIFWIFSFPAFPV